MSHLANVRWPCRKHFLTISHPSLIPRAPCTLVERYEITWFSVADTKPVVYLQNRRLALRANLHLLTQQLSGSVHGSSILSSIHHSSLSLHRPAMSDQSKTGLICGTIALALSSIMIFGMVLNADLEDVGPFSRPPPDSARSFRAPTHLESIRRNARLKEMCESCTREWNRRVDGGRRCLCCGCGLPDRK